MTNKVVMLPDVDYYKMMKKYVFPPGLLHATGFPVLNAEGKLSFGEKNYFGNVSMREQECRCRKTFSLLDENWYSARDCCYHPLKVDIDKDTRSRRYKCCGKPNKSRGCVSSKFHTSSYIPITGTWYLPKRNNVACDNIYALDCEFIFTTVGMEVARVSLVSLYKGVVYDTLVDPIHDVLDLNTQFSGITNEDFFRKSVKTLSEVQYDLTSKFLTKDTILIGHGLHSDLKGLHIGHDKIIDTSILYPHSFGFPCRSSLAHLAKEHLGITIHNGHGHSSIEDAKVCLQLVALKCGLTSLKDIISKF